MRRRLRPEEARLWSLVAATVRRAASGRADAARAEIDPGQEPALSSTPPPGAPAPAILRVPALRPPPPLRPTVESLAELAAAGVGARPTPRAPTRPADPDPGPIEPNRRRRIARAREPIAARLDLHGHDQDAARAALHAFVLAAHAQGARAVLVITGKGRGGGGEGAGVLRRRVPEWLAEPPARAAVAGVSPAEARHGGEGALYVALKRRG